MKLISLLLGIPLLALGASLKARSLPDVDAGCKICHPGDPAYAKWQADVKSVPQTLINEGKKSFSKSFPPGTQPALCSHAGVSCVHLEPGFVWEKNPASLIQDPVGKYSMTDGRKYNPEAYPVTFMSNHFLRVLSLKNTLKSRKYPLTAFICDDQERSTHSSIGITCKSSRAPMAVARSIGILLTASSSWSSTAAPKQLPKAKPICPAVASTTRVNTASTITTPRSRCLRKAGHSRSRGDVRWTIAWGGKWQLNGDDDVR